MRRMTVFSVTGVLGAAFGLGYLLIPTSLLGFFGIEATAGAVLAARFFGASVLGYGVLAWLTRQANPAEDSSKGIALSLAVAAALGTALSLMGVLGGVLNVYGWMAAALFLVLAGAMLSFRFRRG